jgi:hypothetical protein
VEADSGTNAQLARPARIAQRTLYRQRRLRPASRRRERRDEFVADGIGLDTVLRGDGVAEHATEEGDRVRIVRRRLALERRRAFDVREQERHRACGESVHGRRLYFQLCRR